MRTFSEIVDEHQAVVNASLAPFEKNLAPAAELCVEVLRGGGKILVCGNGGSAADGQHFAAELVGRFERERKPWPAAALSTDTSALTAIANDYGFKEIFARQVHALGNKGDLLLALSTSGNSENVVAAARAAADIGMKVIGLTGEGGGSLGKLSDIVFAAASTRTARIQEVHGICLHALAEAIETALESL